MEELNALLVRADDAGEASAENGSAAWEGTSSGSSSRRVEVARRSQPNVWRGLTGTYRVIGRTVPLGVSVGVAVRENGEELDELMRRADAAMYTAKTTGEGGWRLFDPDLDLVQRSAQPRRVELEPVLERE